MLYLTSLYIKSPVIFFDIMQYDLLPGSDISATLAEATEPVVRDVPASQQLVRQK